jgi:hypothetical protein
LLHAPGSGTIESDSAASIKPAHILLQRGRDIVDPVPLQTVIAIAQDQRVATTGTSACGASSNRAGHECVSQ